MLLFIVDIILCMIFVFHFNTSHVTVYPRSHLQSFQPAQFQYISCYCLSQKKKFQISFRIISIHLMLLFIATRASLEEQAQTYFNTSHVTVYRFQVHL